jgi:nucleoside 2-deoxyribosyltransferase
MKIAICSSLYFARETKDIANKLAEKGHKVEIPLYSQKILSGEISFEDFHRIKERDGDAKFREVAPEDLIKRYFKIIKNCDAILVLNLNKKGIDNYIGGNTLLEMGFAYVLEKKIFLFNGIPDVGFKDEIKAMKPIVISQNLDKIL